MKKAVILFLGAFILSGLFYVSGQNRTPKHLVTETVRIGGLDRTYYLFVPESAGSKPMPLVFVFHGGGGTGVGMAVAAIHQMAWDYVTDDVIPSLDSPANPSATWWA